MFISNLLNGPGWGVLFSFSFSFWTPVGVYITPTKHPCGISLRSVVIKGF